MKIIFWFLICILSISISFADITFNKNESVVANEASFWKLLKRKCSKQSIKAEIMQDKEFYNSLNSYPKELIVLALKNKTFEFCYSSFSVVLKFLLPEYKSFVEKMTYKTIKRCFIQGPKENLCLDFKKPEIYYDLTHLLGEFCSPDSLKMFYKVQCRYEYLVKRKCELYSEAGKSIEECPFYFSNKREAIDLGKSFRGKNCKKFKVSNTLKCVGI